MVSGERFSSSCFEVDRGVGINPVSHGLSVGSEGQEERGRE